MRRRPCGIAFPEWEESRGGTPGPIKTYRSGRVALVARSGHPPDIAYVEGMRILIVGAGVIGSVYGAKLLERGHEVVALARGERLIELQERGLILEDAERGYRTALPVSVVDGVSPRGTVRPGARAGSARSAAWHRAGGKEAA